MPEPWPYIYEKFLNVECILHSGGYSSPERNRLTKQNRANLTCSQ